MSFPSLSFDATGASFSSSAFASRHPIGMHGIFGRPSAISCSLDRRAPFSPGFGDGQPGVDGSPGMCAIGLTVLAGVAEQEHARASELRGEVDLDPAVALAVARQRDAALHVDAERLQPLEVGALSVPRVDDSGPHGSARRPAVALRHVARRDRVGIERVDPLDDDLVGERVLVDRELDRPRQRQHHLALVDLDLEPRFRELLRDELRRHERPARSGEARRLRELEEQRPGRRILGDRRASQRQRGDRTQENRSAGMGSDVVHGLLGVRPG